MSNYAILSGNNVVNIVVCDDDLIDSVASSYAKITEETKVASIGMTYDSENNKFIFPQPYSSWSLNENFDWESPEGPNPNPLNKMWDEESLSWIDK
jgi:hypothetical protein